MRLPTYNFALDGGRTNHLINLQTSSNTNLRAIRITSNAEITNPWQALSQYWNSVTKVQQGNTYVYTLQLPQELPIPAGELSLLEYSAQTALGPITNVCMPPQKVEIITDQFPNFTALPFLGANNPLPNPHPQKEFNIYHANWGQYGCNRNMNNENWQAINCLTYAFIGFDVNGNVFSLDNWGDQLELPLLNNQTQIDPNLRTSISFGGWTNAGQRMDSVFSQMAQNPQARANFVKNAVDAVQQAGVNGLDLDWEYVTTADVPNYLALLQELRAELTKRNIPNARLTTTAPAGISNINVFTAAQWQQVAQTVDTISVMTYDYFGAFSDTADFLSPWNFSKNSPHINTGFCVSDTLNLFQQKGVAANKIALGFPNYARSMIIAEEGDFGGLYQPVLGTVPGPNNGIYAWSDIYAHLNGQPSALDTLGVKTWNYYDSTHPYCQDAQMCMLTGQLPTGQWITMNFLDQTSAQNRAVLSNNLGLKGNMLWANYEEPLDNSKGIVAAISNGMNGQVTNSNSKNQLIRVRNEMRAYVRQKSNDQDEIQKINALRSLLQTKNYRKIQEIIIQNKLNKHRSVFKRCYYTLRKLILGDEIPKTKSLELAEKYLAAHVPTKTISKTNMQNNHLLPAQCNPTVRYHGMPPAAIPKVQQQYVPLEAEPAPPPYSPREQVIPPYHNGKQQQHFFALAPNNALANVSAPVDDKSLRR